MDALKIGANMDILLYLQRALPEYTRPASLTRAPETPSGTFLDRFDANRFRFLIRAPVSGAQSQTIADYAVHTRGFFPVRRLF